MDLKRKNEGSWIAIDRGKMSGRSSKGRIDIALKKATESYVVSIICPSDDPDCSTALPTPTASPSTSIFFNSSLSLSMELDRREKQKNATLKQEGEGNTNNKK